MNVGRLAGHAGMQQRRIVSTVLLACLCVGARAQERQRACWNVPEDDTIGSRTDGETPGQTVFPEPR
jgi:hypothetical protein